MGRGRRTRFRSRGIRQPGPNPKTLPVSPFLSTPQSAGPRSLQALEQSARFHCRPLQSSEGVDAGTAGAPRGTGNRRPWRGMHVRARDSGLSHVQCPCGTVDAGGSGNSVERRECLRFRYLRDIAGMSLCSWQELAQALHRSDGKRAVLNPKEIAS
jgi:hypothetical protein